MREISIKYVDFWPEDLDDFIITKILRRHYDVRFSDQPDYLFYSCFGTENMQEKYHSCVKICLLWENQVPDFNFCDYGIAFEYMQAGDRYLRFPLATLYTDAPELYDRQHRSAALEGRKKFCSFIYSDTRRSPARFQILEALNTYKPVDCGGKIGHNIDIPHHEGWNHQQDRRAFNLDYKFSVACENSSTPGYLTEKIVDAFYSGTIPIYWGDPRVKETFNEKAFVCVMDYPDLAAVVQRVKEIDEDDALYEAMLREPVFVKGWDYQSEFDELERFLVHIFEQPKGSAYRRNLYSSYCDKVRGWVIGDTEWQRLCAKRNKNPLWRWGKKVKAKLKAIKKGPGGGTCKVRQNRIRFLSFKAEKATGCVCVILACTGEQRSAGDRYLVNWMTAAGRYVQVFVCGAVCTDKGDSGPTQPDAIMRRKAS